MPPDRRGRDDLIRLLLPSVRTITRRFVRRNRTARAAISEDIYSAGLEGLVRGVDAYDPTKGAPRPYVERRILGAIVDFIRSQDHLSRDYRRKAKVTGVEAWSRPVSINASIASSQAGSRADRTLLDVLSDPCAESPEDAIARWQEAVVIDRAVRRLPGRTQEFLRLYYAEELTMRQIAVAFGVTESRVCQVLHAAQAESGAALGGPPDLRRTIRETCAVYARFGGHLT